jgi:uncharacterized repeat protein (TIGR03943 family)
MRKDAQAVLLFLVGGTLLKISLAGTYLRYVKPSARWLLIAAGIVLVAVAVATLVPLIRDWVRAGQRAIPGSATIDEHAERGPDGAVHVAHDHGRSTVGWLLLLPALAVLAIAPPALGSFQASRNGTALTAPTNSDFAALPDGDPVRISVMDYATRAVFDKGRSLAGRNVRMSGFIIAGQGAPYLARMILTCCAADARPVKIGLTGEVPAGLKSDAWIEVDGTYTDRTDSDPVNGDAIPYINVSAVRSIPTPAAQYES